MGVYYSTCVSADGAPCKVPISEAQEIVKKSPELTDGPGLESEGNQASKLSRMLIDNFIFFYSGQVALHPSSKIEDPPET